MARLAKESQEKMEQKPLEQITLKTMKESISQKTLNNRFRIRPVSSTVNGEDFKNRLKDNMLE